MMLTIIFYKNNQIKKVLFIGVMLWKIPTKENFIFLKAKAMVEFFFVGLVETFGWPYGTLSGAMGPCSYEIWSLSP